MIWALALIIVTPRWAAAQQSGQVPLDLATLQAAAIEADPRYAELRLLARQSELRQRNIAIGRLPSFSLEGMAQYQSDVPSPPALPGGLRLFSPPHATYDGSVRIEQRLFDATLDVQVDVERARLAEQQAGVRTRLFALRQQVNDAFFAAAALQEREAALRAGNRALEGRLNETRARVQAGTTLASDAAAIEAALLERQQELDMLRSERRIAIARLATLTDRAIDADVVLAIPDQLAAQVSEQAAARRTSTKGMARPEIQEFATTRERLDRQQDAASAERLPRVSLFARLGYGRPGLNFIDDRFDTYGLGGVRVQWRWWTWGATGREQEALRLQQQIANAEQASFLRSVDLAVRSDRIEIDRLLRALASDERIVSLREEVERVAAARFEEGAETASAYLDRQADLLRARSARAMHRVALAQARAHLLTTLGLEVR